MDMAGGHQDRGVGCGKCLGEEQILLESGEGWEGRVRPMTSKEEMTELSLAPRSLT